MEMSKPVSSRDSFGKALVEEGKKLDSVVAVAGDTEGSVRIKEFGKLYPERFFQCGIAEENMLGVSAGLALDGKIPVCASFAAFMIGRQETIRASIAYNRANVKMVGTHAGVGIGDDGGSQMALEDLGLMRSFPNVVILQPADDVETRQAVAAMLRHDGPTYLRLTRQDLEPVHAPDYKFEIGKASLIWRPQGADHYQATVIASGGTVGLAKQAAQALEPKGFKVQVLNLGTVKPLDVEAVRKAVRESDRIVTVEDHNLVGGIGSAVGECMAEYGRAVPLVKIGVDDYGESGSGEELYAKFGLTAKHVEDACLRTLA